jgi:hypothetical protein
MPPRYTAQTSGARRLGGSHPFVTNSHQGPIATAAYSSSLIGWPCRGLNPQQGRSQQPEEGVSKYEELRQTDQKDRLGDTWFCSITNPLQGAAYMSSRGNASVHRQAEITHNEDLARQDRQQQELMRRRSTRLQAQHVAEAASIYPLERFPTGDVRKIPETPPAANWFGLPRHERERREHIQKENEVMRIQHQLDRDLTAIEALRRERHAAVAAARGDGPQELTPAETRAATRAAQRQQLERLISKNTAEGKDAGVREARAELSRLSILALREADRADDKSTRVYSSQPRPTLVKGAATAARKPHAKSKSETDRSRSSNGSPSRRSISTPRDAAFPRWQQKARSSKRRTGTQGEPAVTIDR